MNFIAHLPAYFPDKNYGSVKLHQDMLEQIVIEVSERVVMPVQDFLIRYING